MVLFLSLFMSIITCQVFNMVARSQEHKSQSCWPTPGSLTTVLWPLSIGQVKSWGQQMPKGRGNRPHHLTEEVAKHSRIRSVGNHFYKQSVVVYRRAI